MHDKDDGDDKGHYVNCVNLSQVSSQDSPSHWLPIPNKFNDGWQGRL